MVSQKITFLAIVAGTLLALDLLTKMLVSRTCRWVRASRSFRACST